MKAVVSTKYGSADVLELKEIDKPVPKSNQVLVKIQAAAVNPLDWHLLRGEPFLIRMMGYGLFKPKHQILGADFAGIVESVGKDVNEFEAGDEIFGSTLGGFAEYGCFSHKNLVLKPDNMTFEEAASIPVAALTALQGLRKGKIKPGHKVLVNGASGGVGTFAVQIAKHFGAEVTGVCSTGNLELVRSLGADYVIDYTKQDFTLNGKKYDMIFDNVATRSIFKSKNSLSTGGTYLLIGGNSMKYFFQTMLFGPLVSLFSGKKIQSILANTNKEDLSFLSELVSSGKVKSVIGKQYPLSETADAIRYVETGHSRGKVIVQIA